MTCNKLVYNSFLLQPCNQYNVTVLEDQTRALTLSATHIKSSPPPVTQSSFKVEQLSLEQPDTNNGQAAMATVHRRQPTRLQSRRLLRLQDSTCLLSRPDVTVDQRRWNTRSTRNICRRDGNGSTKLSMRRCLVLSQRTREASQETTKLRHSKQMQPVQKWERIQAASTCQLGCTGAVA